MSQPVFHADKSEGAYQVKTGKLRVGISVSESENTSEEELRLFIVDIVTNLLLTGDTIAYGGDLRAGGFSEVIADTTYRHRALQQGALALVDQYIAYPYLEILTPETEEEWRENSVRLLKGSLSFDEKEVASFSNLWARSLSSMREQMAHETKARILVGGRTNEYLGKVPGLIEEARLTLEYNKPLYLIGAFGGATSQVIDAIEGKSFSYNKDNFHQSHEYIQFRYHYNSKTSSEKINEQADAAFFNAYGLQQLSANNGLTPEENRILFYSQDKLEILYCLFRGLKKIVISGK